MRFFLFFILILQAACSGYRFKKQTNPFENFGVKTIAIPLFLNQSSLPNTSAIFTQEISLLLSQYPDLKIVSDVHQADAVLVGVIDSLDKYSETLKTTGHKITNSVAPKSLAGRSDFFVPFSSEVKLMVNFILIRDPLDRELL